MKNIYCLFSVDNNHDQPRNNLVCAWLEKPDFPTFCRAFGLNDDIGKMNVYDAAIKYGETLKLIHLVYVSDYEQRIFGQDYRLEIIEEGKLLKQS